MNPILSFVTDIFSSALAEAQINLDPYEFIDDEDAGGEEDDPDKDSEIPTTITYDDSLQLWSDDSGIPQFFYLPCVIIL